MTRILVTAFEPYGDWRENASWLALVELTRELPANLQVTTRRYPVDFDAAHSRIVDDVNEDYDAVLLLGQAPGSSQIQLEKFGLNVRGEPGVAPESYAKLDAVGPAAMESTLPINSWALELQNDGYPVVVSHHAGEYLCNASLYWTLRTIKENGLKGKAAFVHLPLTVKQVVSSGRRLPSLPVEYSARVVRSLIEKCQQLNRGVDDAT